MDPSQLLSVNLFSWTQIHTLYIVVLVVLVSLSAFFSAAETAYSSINRIRLKNMEANGNKRAGSALRQLENYDRLLSTVLIGNNIVNITASSFATLLFVSLIANNEIAALVSTATITAAILIFGEITPKSFAKDGAEKFAVVFYPVLDVLLVLFAPFNAVFFLWKKLLRKIFKIKKELTITGDELITMIEEVENEGGLERHESQLIRSAIEFDDVNVRDVMVPRVKVVAIEDDYTMDEIAEVFHESNFSRLPIYSETIDSVIGIIHEKDFNILYRQNRTDIKSILSDSICVSEQMKISDALRLLQKSKVHLAIVVDEFGGTAGIVTMEDILEELVGEIYDEHDEIEVFFNKVNDSTFIFSGSENFEEMEEILNLNCKEEYESTTVGGWVTEVLKRIPAAGERFDFYGHEIEITKANAKSVLEIKATRSNVGKSE